MDVSSITRGIESDMNGTASLADVTIERGEFLNSNPDAVPWVGIYRREISYDPRTLGNHSRSWQGNLKLTFVCQEASIESGAECEDRLEQLVDKVAQTVFDSPTFKGKVDIVHKMRVEYSYREGDEESLYFQMAMIHIDAEVSTG